MLHGAARRDHWQRSLGAGAETTRRLRDTHTHAADEPTPHTLHAIDSTLALLPTHRTSPPPPPPFLSRSAAARSSPGAAMEMSVGADPATQLRARGPCASFPLDSSLLALLCCVGLVWMRMLVCCRISSSTISCATRNETSQGQHKAESAARTWSQSSPPLRAAARTQVRPEKNAARCSAVDSGLCFDARSLCAFPAIHPMKCTSSVSQPSAPANQQ